MNADQIVALLIVGLPFVLLVVVGLSLIVIPARED